MLAGIKHQALFNSGMTFTVCSTFTVDTFSVRMVLITAGVDNSRHSPIGTHSIATGALTDWQNLISFWRLCFLCAWCVHSHQAAMSINITLAHDMCGVVPKNKHNPNRTSRHTPITSWIRRQNYQLRDLLMAAVLGACVSSMPGNVYESEAHCVA